MTRLLFLFAGLLLLHMEAGAQQNPELPPQKRLGITYASFGSNDVVRADELDGAGGYNGDKFYTVGIRYLHPVHSNWLAIETGLEFARHTIVITPAPTGRPRTSHTVHHSLLSIPVGARARFLQFLFANAGFLIDIDTGSSGSIDNQNGIGAQIGLGIEYDFVPGFSIFINPYQKIHALLPFALEKNHQKIVETGVKVGVMIGW